MPTTCINHLIFSHHVAAPLTALLILWQMLLPFSTTRSIDEQFFL
jgi:hypothetical protein